MATATRKPSLSAALAQRRLATAQRRISDLSVNEQPDEGKGQIAVTPAPESGISTDQVMDEAATEDTTNIDSGLPSGVDLSADERTDVTVRDDVPFNSVPQAQSARRQRRTVADATEGGDDGQGNDGEGFEGTDEAVAVPDLRVDVETPVANTTDDRAQDSQYDPAGYDNNQGDDLKDPDLTTDQNWVPGHASKLASPMSAMMLVDAYLQAGLTTVDQKFARFAEFEKLPQAVINDRMALLAAVAKATPATQASAARPSRASVPRAAGRTAGIAPSMGTRPQRLAGNDQSDTTLLFV